MKSFLNGAIESFDLPEGWIEEDISPFVGDSGASRYFSDPKIPNVRICHFENKQILDASALENLQSLLSESPHPLSAKEWIGLQSALAPACSSSAFVPHGSNLINLNGRAVIAVRGMLKESKQFAHLIFYLTDSSLHSVYYVAAPEPFKEHLSKAENTFASVIWRAGN